MKSSYGYFTKDGKEFVIDEYKTKLPLINYCWNNNFITAVNQCASGRGAFMERTMQYMHPVQRCDIIKDENRHFYMHDIESKDIWSPGWYPVNNKLDEFEARHGLGYSKFNTVFRNIRTKMRVFVPEEMPLEIWTVTLKNEGSVNRKIKFFPFAEFILNGYDEYAHYSSSLNSHYDPESFAVNAINGALEGVHDWFGGFVASDIKPAGYDGARTGFIGEYGSVARPEAVLEGSCRNSSAVSEYMVGALEIDFELSPDEEKTVNIAIGATNSAETTRDICRNIFSDGKIEEEYKKLCAKVDKDMSNVRVETPDERINLMFNTWIKREIQLHTEVGTDTGRGFRDVMQSAWGSASYDPEGTRQKIIDCLMNQYADGHTLRGWNPVDEHHYSDGPVWIPPTINTYLKESGDYGILDEKVKYFDGGEATVWEHLLQAVRHSTEDLGPNGLIKAHFGDWNDSLNWIGIKGSGESVWTSIGMIFAINHTIEIIENVKKDEAVLKEMIERREKLTETVQTKGWDGKWYLQGINDAGEKVGSSENKEGQKYLNSQTWSIMAGIAKGERYESIIDVIDNDLECDYGSMVLTPAYTKKDEGVGRISQITPGLWENGAPYSHGVSFKVLADTVAGRGDKAYSSFKKLLPDNPDNPSTKSGCPPYVLTNMFYGPDHPRKGEILYSWITGTATWLFRALTQHMIGVRGDYKGILVDPCMPSEWDRARLTYNHKGATYEVEVLNPDGKQTGVKSVTVDGKVIEGNIVPDFADGRTHKIVVEM
ncbi:MAG: GH36-type glycosyl hydrolase domain-containing protein [Fibrobacterota bacterium]